MFEKNPILTSPSRYNILPIIAQAIFILFMLKTFCTILSITEDMGTFFLKVIENSTVWLFAKKIISH